MAMRHSEMAANDDVAFVIVSGTNFWISGSARCFWFWDAEMLEPGKFLSSFACSRRATRYNQEHRNEGGVTLREVQHAASDKESGEC